MATEGGMAVLAVEAAEREATLASEKENTLAVRTNTHTHDLHAHTHVCLPCERTSCLLNASAKSSCTPSPPQHSPLVSSAVILCPDLNER